MDLSQVDIDKSKKILDLFRAVRKSLRNLFIENIKQYNLTESKLLLISELRATPFITLSELSGRLSLSKGTVSCIVTQLESQGVVIREIPRDNRRIVKLSLAPGYSDIIDVNMQYISDLIKNADPKDIDIILQGLQKFCDLLENDKEHG